MPGYHSSGCIAGSIRDAACVQCMGGAAVGPFDWARECEYTCSSGFYRVNDTLCMQCSSPACSAGFYASECLDSADVVCLPCATPANGPVNWTGGCEWECADGYFLSDSGECVPCTVPVCFPGFRPVACSRTGDAYCAACDVPGGDPGGYVWSEFGGVCGLECTGGFYFGAAEDGCIRCSSSRACVQGTYLVACNTTADSRCADCPAPAGAFAWGDAACTFSCVGGWRSGLSQCSRCSSPVCGAGSYASACTQLSDAVCLPCQEKPGEVASFVWTAGCSYACAVGFFRDNSSCVQCSTPACVGGTMRQTCTATSDARCIGCGSVQPEGRVVWDSKGSADGCGYSCAAGSYMSGVDCVDCTTPWCAPGWRPGQCSTTADAQCEACGAPWGLADGSYVWTGDGVCSFDCADGFYMQQDLSSCLPCSTDGCEPGFYRTGCSPAADAVCGACQYGGSVGGVVWTIGCEFVCGAGYYHSRTLGGCTACTRQLCAPGWLLSACNATSDAVCSLCALPLSTSGVNWSQGGVSCAFACKFGFYRSGDQCLACSQPQCAPGSRLLPCTSTADAVCAGCEVAVTGGFRWSYGCQFECMGGYFREENACVLCSDELDCPPGYIQQSCTLYDDARCVGCGNTYYGTGASWSAGCDFVCVDGFFMAGPSCAPCSDPVACNLGSYPIKCNASHDFACSDCAAPGEPGSFTWSDNANTTCQSTCCTGFYRPADSSDASCIPTPPPTEQEPLVFVVVSTALAMNNTVDTVCAQLGTLLLALSEAVNLVLRGNESGLCFVTNVTAFDAVPCADNVCPQCNGSSLAGGRRRILQAGGVSLSTVSTSTAPILQTSVFTAVQSAPSAEQFQSALVVSLASIAPSLNPSGVVAAVSSVAVPLVTPSPRLAIYDEGGVQWAVPGVVTCVLLLVVVGLGVLVGAELRRECGQQYSPVAVGVRVGGGMSGVEFPPIDASMRRRSWSGDRLNISVP